MRIIKEMTLKDYNYSLKSIDDDFKNGVITREQARRSVEKIKQAYKSGEVNKGIDSAIDRAKFGKKNYLRT